MWIAVTVGGVVLVLLLLATPALLMNVVGPRIDRKRLSHDDEFVFDHYCSTGTLHRLMRVYRRMPAEPRCKLCYAPFGGLGRMLGIKPSRKNSNFCRSCFETVPLGGSERDVGVLFADLRGFTEWSGHTAPAAVAASLEGFYKASMNALMAHDAIIDKFVGDAVMALFLPEMPSLGDRTCDEMLRAAMELAAGAPSGSDDLGVGIGIHFGKAWVGNVGTEDMKDFTALGDVVNVASRLQGCAQPGQIVISAEAFARLTEPVASAPASFNVKGKDAPLAAYVVAATLSGNSAMVS